MLGDAFAAKVLAMENRAVRAAFTGFADAISQHERDVPAFVETLYEGQDVPASVRAELLGAAARAYRDGGELGRELLTAMQGMMGNVSPEQLEQLSAAFGAPAADG